MVQFEQEIDQELEQDQLKQQQPKKQELLMDNGSNGRMENIETNTLDTEDSGRYVTNMEQPQQQQITNNDLESLHEKVIISFVG